MANVFHAERISNELMKRIKTAWSPAGIFDYPPLETGLTLPIATVLFTGANKGESSSVCYRAIHEFTIIGRWAWPASGTVTKFKNDRANEAYTNIVTGFRFTDLSGDIGDIHDIGGFDSVEIDGEQEKTLEIRMSFSIQTETNKR